MNYRRFGRTAWNVSEIGYGMWGLAGWTGSDDAESLDALERAVDLGCNFFDTAWAYGDGRSEQILGKVLRSNGGKKLYVNSAQKPQMAQPPRFYPRRLLSAGPHRSVRQQEPCQSRRR